MLLVSTKNQDTNVDVKTVTKNLPPDVLTSMNVKPMQKVNVQQHCVIIVLIKFSNFFFCQGSTDRKVGDPIRFPHPWQAIQKFDK